MRTEVYRLNRNNLTAAVEDVMRLAVSSDKAKVEEGKKEGAV